MKGMSFLGAFLYILSISVQPSWAKDSTNLWANALSVPLHNTESQQVGEAQLLQTPNGVLIRLNLSNFAPGTHGFHIHEVGKCEPPSFTSAGDHFSPSDKAHGILDAEGKHAGDLPNIHIPESGSLTLEALATDVALKDGKNRLLDSDGAALVIHTDPDDYRTDPAGDAGERMACGVIAEPSPGPQSQPTAALPKSQ